MTFSILLFAYVLSQFYRAFLAVMAADLTRDLGLDAASLGSLPAAWLLAFAFAQFPIGYALDRFGPRRTLAGGMMFAVAGAILLAGATTYATCLLAMALIGVGCAPVLMTGMYIAARLYSLESFATFSSLLIGIGTLGDPLSGFPLAAANAALGWRATMLGIAAVTMLCVLVVWMALPEPRAERGRQVTWLAGFRAIFGMRALWPIFPITFVSYAVTVATRGLWVAPYLADVQGFGPRATALAATAMGFAMGVGALLYIPVSRAIGAPKPTVLAGVALCAGLFLALALVGGHDPALAVGLLLGAGATGTSYAILMAHARSFMSAAVVGRGVTIMNFFFMGGGGVTQWLSGAWVHAAAARGLGADATYGRLFAGFGVVLMLSLAVYLFAPRSPARQPATEAV